MSRELVRERDRFNLYIEDGQLTIVTPYGETAKVDTYFHNNNVAYSIYVAGTLYTGTTPIELLYTVAGRVGYAPSKRTHEDKVEADALKQVGDRHYQLGYYDGHDDARREVTRTLNDNHRLELEGVRTELLDSLKREYQKGYDKAVGEIVGFAMRRAKEESK